MRRLTSTWTAWATMRLTSHIAANDRDTDGVTRCRHDAFPDDAAETKDSDDDGVGNNADAFPGDGDGDG